MLNINICRKLTLFSPLSETSSGKEAPNMCLEHLDPAQLVAYTKCNYCWVFLQVIGHKS